MDLPPDSSNHREHAPLERRTTGFHLSKWYLDCITPDGEAFVAYAATLSWKSIRLKYAATLLRGNGQTIDAKSSFRCRTIPQHTADCVTWRNERLGVDATWRRAADPIERVIYNCRDGHIRWSCIMPRSVAVIDIPGKRREPLQGTGYVERVDMTVVPWRLPLETLRWGRFHSPAATVVWIDMIGGLSGRLVFRDGVPLPCETVDDGLLESKTAGLRLELERSATLRRGAIGTNVIKVDTPIRRLVPVPFLRLNEQKWISRGSLSIGTSVEMGWAIHEVVLWPQEPGQ